MNGQPSHTHNVCMYRLDLGLMRLVGTCDGKKQYLCLDLPRHDHIRENCLSQI